MARETAIALALAALAGLTVVVILIYVDRITIAEGVAEQCDTGRCFVCRQPLRHRDDVGNLNDQPGLGYAHFACLQDVYGPITEEIA